MIEPGRTIRAVTEAPIPRVKDLTRGRKGVLSFAQGLPWFGPPPEALTRTLDRLKAGEGDGYSDDPGLPRLRGLVASDLGRHGLAGIRAGNILLTPGANQAVYIALSVLADPGDEVILFRPYYFNNLMALQMLGLRAVFVETGPAGEIDPGRVRRAVNRRTRALILISPDNPTGAVVGREVREELFGLARERGFACLSDEAYRDFTWVAPPPPLSIGGDNPVIGIFSFSKSYGMAGWRLGYMAAPEGLAAEALKAADTLHICPPVPAQILAEEILAAEANYPGAFSEDMRRSRDILIAALRPLWEKGLTGEPRSDGGFYIFLRLFPKDRMSGWEISRRLAEDWDLAVMPGEAFGADREPFIRLSYGNIRAADMPEAATRLAAALAGLLRKPF